MTCELLTPVRPRASGSIRVLLVSCYCTFLHGSFFYFLVRQQLCTMRQRQVALEDIGVLGVPGSAFLDSLGWSAPLYASLFYLILVGALLLGFLLLSLLLAAPLKRGFFLLLGLMVFASSTFGYRSGGSFLALVTFSFGSFYLLTLTTRIHFAPKEVYAFLLIAALVSLSLFYGSRQNFFVKARDRLLFGSALGVGVTSWYYQYSPLAAALISPEKGIYQCLVFDQGMKDGSVKEIGQGIILTGNRFISGKADFEISRHGQRTLMTNRYGKSAVVGSVSPSEMAKGIDSLFGMKGLTALTRISLYLFPGGSLILMAIGIRCLTGDRRVFSISIGASGTLMVSFVFFVILTGGPRADEAGIENAGLSKQGLSVAYDLEHRQEIPPQCRPAVMEMVQSHSPALRCWGVHLLGIGGKREDAEQVKRLLEDPVPNVRYTAARSLYRLIRRESFDSLIIRLVSDPSWYVRCKVYSLFLDAGTIPSRA